MKRVVEEYLEMIIKEFDIIIIENDDNTLSHLKEVQACSIYEQSLVLIVIDQNKNLIPFIDKVFLIHI